MFYVMDVVSQIVYFETYSETAYINITMIIAMVELSYRAFNIFTFKNYIVHKTLHFPCNGKNVILLFIIKSLKNH